MAKTSYETAGQAHRKWYNPEVKESRLKVRFFRTASGKEPVRAWLRGLDNADRRAIGEDIKTVQYGWPLGMPVVRKLEQGLWEVRTGTSDRTARVIFTVKGDTMVLLHGFIKKSRKTGAKDLATARQRMRQLMD